MAFNPGVHHRRSIRLKGYDYSQGRAYFVTICTRNRECLLGAVQDGKMVLNDVGHIVESVWQGLPNHFPTVGLDASVIMPNHFHGIIIVGAQFIAPCRVGRSGYAPTVGRDGKADQEGVMNHAPTLGKILRTFKAASTRLIRKTTLAEFVWQRNYYEHVVRNERALNAIRRYIQVNPLLWAYDRENLQAAPIPGTEIDRVLAKHYGFTDEELDFIINYDIKYRMGQDAEGEDE